MADTVCMIAYANYFTDARIKNYVHTLLKSGRLVDVFALGPSDVEHPGLRLYCLLPKVWSSSVVPYVLSQMWFLLVVLIRVGVSFMERRYSVVHVHNMPNFVVFGALIPKLGGARIILDVHDTMPEAYATKFDLPLTHPLIHCLRLEERLSAWFADLVITTNDLHKKALIEHGIPSAKIAVIMNLGNPGVFRPWHPVEEDAGLLLAYHGTIAARLGLDLIVNAVSLARPHCPQLRFLLMGDGDFLAPIARLISTLGLADCITLTGWVAVEDLPQYLQRAQVGVVGIRRSYELHRNWALPVKMLEFAAMEVPCIAPRLSVIQHYFDENSAFYYTPDDVEDCARQIRNVYQHREKLLEAKQHLRRFNARYSWQLMEDRYLSILD
jgi:glycosyltransferase involved in cell wall biosynthesis